MTQNSDTFSLERLFIEKNLSSVPRSFFYDSLGVFFHAWVYISNVASFACD